MRLLRRRRGALALVWLAVLTLSVATSRLSLAFFTDQQPTTGVFSSGTIVLGVAPTSTLVTFGGMVPGNQVEGVLTVANTGSGALRYAMTTAASDPDGKGVRAVLQLTVERRTGCSGPILETIYDGPLASGVIGDPAIGDHPGDRALAGGASEAICFRVTLPTDTDVLYQGAATTAAFTFAAEQSANNP